MCKKCKYVGLHNHTHFSILDGYAKVDEYIAKAKEMGMIGIGIADHGTASGLYQLITKAQKADLIPVPGIEFYVAPQNPLGAKVKKPVFYGSNGRKAPKYDVGGKGAYLHLTVYAYNNVGLSNLFKLTSLSWKPENFYVKPRIDTNMLLEHHEGLIVTTGCPSSEVSRRFLLGQDKEAYAYATRLKEVFGENMYVEIMQHNMVNEDLENILIPKQIKLAKDLNIPIIATNDSHYADKNDAIAHEHQLAIQSNSDMSEKPTNEGGSRFAFSGPEYYLKSDEEMFELMPKEVKDEALANTIKLTEKCKGISLDYSPDLRPEIKIPENFNSSVEYFKYLINVGFKNKRGDATPETKEESKKRIANEFKVIHGNDFINYFLVVHDYIDFAHKNGIKVGPGRGCFMPGSIVSTHRNKKKIEQIKKGDKVLTHDCTIQNVEDVFVYDVVDEDMVKLTLNNGKIIECTSDHLIFDKQSGFTQAGALSIGDIVLGAKKKKGVFSHTLQESSKDEKQKEKKLEESKKSTSQEKDENKTGYFTSYQQNKKQIHFASSYEERVLTVLETDSNVESFGRSSLRLKYKKPSTNLIHNYLPDFEVLYKDGTKKIIEVKAEWQAKEEDTASKLSQAKEQLNKLGYTFEVWTENTLSELNDAWHNDFEIIKVEKFKYTGKVYDLQVSNVHNYTINGVTVHNSVGGSEIAYLLDISDTDPIRFDLLFERFLSVGRGSVYLIKYVNGESEEIAVSEKKARFKEDGTYDTVYVHELRSGDVVNYKNKKCVIEASFVYKPGSAPDIDTDFHTERRQEVIDYCIERHGKENVANIITFGEFKAKNSFKGLATIYNMPFAEANFASKLIPEPEEGQNITLAELVDPNSFRYNEGADFRKATEGKDWKNIIDMAIPFEGRVRNTGVHACGVIIANTPLSGIIPTQVRQKDNTHLTQWTYPECEALGLIKMDFLGLDALDIIELTLENIRAAGKTVPDMRKLIRGNMDDKKTYDMLKSGDIVGVFQLGGDGVGDLITRSQPNCLDDIATITALFRPGPMSTNAHIEWADRKRGVSEIVYIDESLKDSVLKDILGPTSGILVYQEQIMHIASRFAGMDSYQADLLRKAMGKKKMDVMMKMQPVFIEGAMKVSGVTQSVAQKVWDTMEGFAQYGFNLSHAVSYALLAYQTAYLKANFLAEFMAARIQQADPKKVKMYTQEAISCGLKIGPISINSSQFGVSATKAGASEYDIVYGFSRVKNININVAKSIAKERENNGDYRSVADFVKRITKVEKVTSKVVGNLALSGAFDEFGVSRKMVNEKASALVKSGNQKAKTKASLFDMAGMTDSDATDFIKLVGLDFSYVDRIKEEAKATGIFVSGHPTANLGIVAKKYKPVTIRDIKDNKYPNKGVTVLGTITEIVTKVRKNKTRSMKIVIDDGTSTMQVFLPKPIINSIIKGEELIALKGDKNYKVPPEYADIMNDEKITPMKPLELYDVYAFAVKYTVNQSTNATHTKLGKIQHLKTAPNGSLTYDIKIKDKQDVKILESIINNHKPKEQGVTVYIGVHLNGSTKWVVPSPVNLTRDLIIELENKLGNDCILIRGI